MGFNEAEVIQAYFACEKNEALTVEFLLNQHWINQKRRFEVAKNLLHVNEKDSRKQFTHCQKFLFKVNIKDTRTISMDAVLLCLLQTLSSWQLPSGKGVLLEFFCLQTLNWFFPPNNRKIRKHSAHLRFVSKFHF